MSDILHENPGADATRCSVVSRLVAGQREEDVCRAEMLCCDLKSVSPRTAYCLE